MQPIQGQISVFDLDSQCGKTFQARSVATKGQTSERCSKPSAVSKTQTLLYLNLKGGAGLTPDASWETVTVLPGASMTLNTGECPSVARESTLSLILQANAPEKYCLSAKACQGILRRAEKRGKELPPMLREALEEVVSLSKSEQDAQGGGKGILVQRERATTLATNTDQSVCYETPAAFMGGQGAKARSIAYCDDGTTPTLKSTLSGGNTVPDVCYCLQGNGIDRADTESCNGRGWREGGSYTLNTIDRPAVVYPDKARSLCARYNSSTCVDRGQETVVYRQTGFADYDEGCGTLRASGGDFGGGTESIVVTERAKDE